MATLQAASMRCFLVGLVGKVSVAVLLALRCHSLPDTAAGLVARTGRRPLHLLFIKKRRLRGRRAGLKRFDVGR